MRNWNKMLFSNWEGSRHVINIQITNLIVQGIKLIILVWRKVSVLNARQIATNVLIVISVEAINNVKLNVEI